MQEKKWEYEFIFVLPPSLEKQKQAVVVKSLKDAIAKIEGKVTKEIDWGQKDLAYPIKDHSGGQYFVWQITFSESPSLKETDLFLSRQEGILRYLWIRI